MENTDEAAKAVALLAVRDESTTSKVIALIDRLGMIRSIGLATCALSVLSVSIASTVHGITGDPIGWTGLFNTALIPFILGVPTLIVLLGLLRELADTRAQLTRLSMLDGLTGALNRRSLLEVGHRACEDGRAGALCVALIDADLFKQINDAHGHITGDETLRCITGVIRRHLPADCVCGRYGGEEFAVVLSGHSLEQARELMETIRGEIESACVEVNERPVGATISAGIAAYGDTAPDMEALLGQADQALYAAKDAGRNRVRLAPSDPP